MSDDQPTKRIHIRSTVSVILDLVGLIGLAVSGWLIAPWVGIGVFSIGCIVVAWAIDPPAPVAFEIPVEEEQESAPTADVARPVFNPSEIPPNGINWRSEG